VSYSRFLALTLVEELGASTQRALAECLGVTEPSVSRTTGLLAADGLLSVIPDPAGGNRRRLTLTDAGRRLVVPIREQFEEKLSALVAFSGVSYDEYAASTSQLLAAVEAMEKKAEPK
jgi:DNA-binding MarR family transcriptional regulator